MSKLINVMKYVVVYWDESSGFRMEEVSSAEEMDSCKGYGNYAGSSKVKCIVPNINFVKLEGGFQHAMRVGATHQRDGDIYKVTHKVQCWKDGSWSDVNQYWEGDEWLEELTPIDWSNSI